MVLAMSATQVSAFLPPSSLPVLSRKCLRACPSRRRHAGQYIIPRSQASPPSDPAPRRENDLLKRLEAISDFPESNPEREEVANSRSRVMEALRYLNGNLSRDVERFFSNPASLLPAGALAILFGFFSATSASTIIGSVADWDPLAAAVLLVWTEGFTKYYYALKRKSKLLQLINAFKIGLMFGMAVDAFKLST